MKKNILIVILIIIIVVLASLAFKSKESISVSTEPVEQSSEKDNNISQTNWTKSSKFGLYYPSNFNAPMEYYRAEREIVYEPSSITAPEFSLVFPDGRAVITWGGYRNIGEKRICSQSESGIFQYGRSEGACIKGYQAWVAHFSGRDTVTIDELKIFGDFVLKNQ